MILVRITMSAPNSARGAFHGSAHCWNDASGQPWNTNTEVSSAMPAIRTYTVHKSWIKFKLARISHRRWPNTRPIYDVAFTFTNSEGVTRSMFESNNYLPKNKNRIWIQNMFVQQKIVSVQLNKFRSVEIYFSLEL